MSTPDMERLQLITKKQLDPLRPYKRVPSRVQARDEPCADTARCDIHGHDDGPGEALNEEYQKAIDYARENGIQDCQLCGEPGDDEMGEFWDPAKNISVIAHAQCGLDAGLPLA